MEILCYCRKPMEDMLYAEKLAYSMHLAWRRSDGEKFVPFHHNEGLLYAKAVQKEDGTLTAKSLRAPWIFAKKEGGFGVLAVRIEADGKPDAGSEGCVLLWESEDLVRYREVGLLRLQERGHIRRVSCTWREEEMAYCLLWENEDKTVWQADGDVFAGKIGAPICLKAGEECGAGADRFAGFGADGVSEADFAEIEGCVPGSLLRISEEQGEYLLKKLMPPKFGERASVKFPFPFAEHRADPCCMYRHGRYYFIATNDADDNHTLYIRCADTLEGIITAPETLLLDSDTYPGIGGLLWAPEFHEIDGKLYIFHAATEGEFFREECRVMELREGGDPMRREDWSEPRLVVKRDGTPLCEAGKVISLDMTTFEYEGGVYAMWSQRQFLPVDQGAWLYLAQIDRAEPWKLISDPVCVALPEYGWENNHTFVVEGPYAIWKDGQLMVTYSGAAVDATYAVGMLKPVMGSDILNPDNWRKNNYPLLSSRSVPGEFGPGHNSYLTDEDGVVWNFYHARPGVDGPRSSCARRVYFDIDGEPMLDVTED